MSRRLARFLKEKKARSSALVDEIGRKLEAMREEGRRNQPIEDHFEGASTTAELEQDLERR